MRCSLRTQSNRSKKYTNPPFCLASTSFSKRDIKFNISDCSSIGISNDGSLFRVPICGVRTN